MVNTYNSSKDTPYAPHGVELGAFRITALHDGHFDLPTSFFGSPAGLLPGRGEETFRLDVNAFLIQSASRNILVDVGAGAKLGPDVNKLTKRLHAVGVRPAEIDAVLCTHIHPDHTNGLIDINNAPLFTNAQIFVHQNEFDYWLSDEQYAKAPESTRNMYDWTREAFAPYAGRIEPFTSGEVLPGIEVIPLFGHTPGHCGFHVDGGGNRQLVIWGDAVHNIDVQSRNPELSAQADVSQDEARQSRQRLFDRVVADDVLITGMHVSYPGFGRMRRDGAGFEYSAQR